MFRAKEEYLQEDPTFPANLKELGLGVYSLVRRRSTLILCSFFVNNIGQLRMTEFPDKDYQYQFSNSERYNELRREAMQGKLSSLLITITSPN